MATTDKLAALQAATQDAADAAAEAEAGDTASGATGNTNTNNTSNTADKITRSTTFFKNEKLKELDGRFGPMFEGSVYREILYYTHTKSKSALIFGVIVWMCQMYLYSQFFVS